MWSDSNYLERYYLLGTNDNDYVEIPEERALEIIEEWVSLGRLARGPDEPGRRERRATKQGGATLKAFQHLVQRKLRRRKGDA